MTLDGSLLGPELDIDEEVPTPPIACLDGNGAAALVAHRLSDVCAIHPITPASAMGELAGEERTLSAEPDEELGHAGPIHYANHGDETRETD